MSVALIVNGRAVSVDTAATTPLLDVLRNHLDLKGTRYGCGLEQCGTCMVLLDGEPDYSCAREVGSVAGRHVTTIEGLGSAEHPHVLQRAFLEEQAGQCGYCLSGIIISAKALLDRNPTPSRRRDRCRAGQASVPLRHAYADHQGGPEGGRHGSLGMSDTLPLSIQNNRRMDKWLRFQPGPDRQAGGRQGGDRPGGARSPCRRSPPRSWTSRSNASTSWRATPMMRPTRARPVRASRSRYRAARCGWSARNCARASSGAWRSG